MIRTLAIDPSVNSLGWAIFEDTKLCASGTVKGDAVKKLCHEERIEYIIDRLYIFVNDWKDGANHRMDVPQISSVHPFDYILIEKPALWGARKSVASQHSGDLLGLHILVGALYWWGYKYCGTKCLFIPVSEWKGQLPKRVTMRRMKEKYCMTFGDKDQNHDEADAVGVGDYYITEVLKLKESTNA